MIKNLIKSGAYTSGNNVSSTNMTNTNDKYEFDASSDTFKVKISGLTEVKANVAVNVTSGGVLTLQLYSDGQPIPGAFDTKTVVSGQTKDFHINDVIRTVYSVNDSYINLSFKFDSDCTLSGGDIILMYER